MSKIINLEIFIAMAEAKHGVGRYDYSATTYLRNPAPLEIKCPTHGIFRQSSGNHLAGQGCKKCADKQRGLNRVMPVAKTIARFRAKHGDKYDYSLLPSIFLIRDQIPIICPVHGVFYQEAFTHTTAGCRFCSDDCRGVSRRFTFDQFVQRSQEVHGIGTYNYYEAEYKGSKAKTIINCPKHGDFWQVPSSHFNAGAGCTKCANARKRRYWIDEAAGRLCTLYLLRVFGPNEEFFKVGITYRRMKQRYSGPSALGGYQHEVLAEHKSTNAKAVFEWEQSIIETFAHLNYKPKIYFDGASECFSSADEILQIFPL